MTRFFPVAEAASLLPGQGRTVQVRGREFALYNLGGEFFAIDDRCPHRGGPLGAGTLEEGRVYCPLHGWAFDPKTGACHSNPERPVRSYPTRVVGGQVQIACEFDSPSSPCFDTTNENRLRTGDGTSEPDLGPGEAQPGSKKTPG